jgi:hypothetical protein
MQFYYVFWQDGDFSQHETVRKENAAEKPLEVEESRRYEGGAAIPVLGWQLHCQPGTAGAAV